MRNFLIIFLSIFLLIGCNPDKQSQDLSLEKYDCNIRLLKEPGQVNPFYAPTSIGRELFQYIFLPLADYHPETMELSPILITKIPEAKEIKGDGLQSLISLDVTFKENANWSDGTPITSQDYAFTVKAIKHSNSKATAWQPYFSFIKDVIQDSNDPKKFSIIVDGDYMLAKETALTSFIMPSHIYDEASILKNVSVETLSQEAYVESDSSIIAVIEKANASINQKTDVVQNGPYKLTDYQTDLYYVLERVENHWGANEDHPFLNAYPEKIILKVVPDELTALNMAQEAKLDFLTLNDGNKFVELKEDTAYNQEWSFHVPQLMMFLYLAINNKDEILSDKNMRRALAHVADVDDYIENLSGGLGMRTTGCFLPAKSYYNDKLKPIEYNIEKAKALLSESGWTDTNGNGIADKDGKELELDFLITGSSLSKNLSLLFQESAKKAGIGINVIAKKTTLMRQENLSNFNFDIAALVITGSAALNDPYDRWHSDNAKVGKRNFLGYENEEADKLIEKLRVTKSETERKELYLKLQEIMYEDQPAVFLYSPLQKMMINKNYDALTSPKRPGYHANTFKRID